MDLNWNDTLDNNPFRVLRESLLLTQEGLAVQANMTTQMVYRHENGLINTPSYRLGAALLWLSMSDQEKIRVTSNKDTMQESMLAVKALDHEYHIWKTAMRHAVSKLYPRPTIFLFGPYNDVNGLRDEHPFVTFMYNVTSTLGHELSLPGDLRSQQLFNRLLCIHPRSVQQLLANERDATIQGVLLEALSDIGIDDTTINFINQQIYTYNKRMFLSANLVEVAQND